ncbi:MAG: PD40 domain-containing protein [Planctomycetes bacterium]|nr:PD40 domain-containing protein [Planctomycetota bacterium]
MTLTKAASAVLSLALVAGAAPQTEIVSLGAGGQGNFPSNAPASVSNDGRYVAFASFASNLVAGDTNNRADVFLRDGVLGTTVRVSTGPGGVEGDADSSTPSMSADGRYIAFQSLATNLAPLDFNGRSDVFLYDRATSTLSLVSRSSFGSFGNAASAKPVVSADGRFVAFESLASNLVTGDTNNASDIFMSSTTALGAGPTRVSVDSSGSQGGASSFNAALSATGRFVVWDSNALNFEMPDLNNVNDVFMRDLQTGQTIRVSKDASGFPGFDTSLAGSVSADGRFVSFTSFANNLVPGDSNLSADIFVKDTQTGAIERVSVGPAGVQGNFGSTGSRISADGRFVAFQSDAVNLVAGDTNGKSDIFVRDRQSGVTERADVSTAGAQSNNSARSASLSADGRYLTFETIADNLVAGDSNTFIDVFLRTRALCAADLDADAAVNTADLALLLSSFGRPVAPGTSGDYNSDGVVNTLDLAYFLTDFGCSN